MGAPVAADLNAGPTAPHETVACYGLIDKTRIDARVDCYCEPGTVHLSGALSVLKLLSAAVNS